MAPDWRALHLAGMSEAAKRTAAAAALLPEASGRIERAVASLDRGTEAASAALTEVLPDATARIERTAAGLAEAAAIASHSRLATEREFGGTGRPPVEGRAVAGILVGDGAGKRSAEGFIDCAGISTKTQ